MNNLSSYCGLVDAKIRASDKDLPVDEGVLSYTGQANLECDDTVASLQLLDSIPRGILLLWLGELVQTAAPASSQRTPAVASPLPGLPRVWPE